jgi:transcriptional regulator with XRE-family HTH domain
MPHPIDLMVGKRIRLRRIRLSISQAELAQRLGVRFQQVQKYENGTNRVSSSRLFEIATVLGVPIGYFFSAANDVETIVTEHFDAADLKDGFRLMTAFSRIRDSAIRKILIALLDSIVVEDRDPN